MNELEPVLNPFLEAVPLEQQLPQQLFADTPENPLVGDSRGLSDLLARLEALAENPYFTSRYAGFVEALEIVPDNIAQKFVKRIESALALVQKRPVRAENEIRGAMFELSRLKNVVQQGLETVDFGQGVSIGVVYQGYKRKETDFSKKNLKENKSEIESDIPLIRNIADKNGERKKVAYVYETKFYPLHSFGAYSDNRNQILKYQQAINDGSICGATIEFTGSVDRDFLQWLIGPSFMDIGATPDVQVIYALTLPSGAEYKIELNRGKPNNGLCYFNDNVRLTHEDQEVITGINLALLDHSIINILAGKEVDNPSEELKICLDDPFEKITTLELMDEYETARRKKIQSQLIDKAEKNKINETNERSSVEIMALGEEERRAYLEQVFDRFQSSLEHDPAMKPMHDRYAIHDLPTRGEVIRATLRMIQCIADYEMARAAGPDGLDRPGYVGRPEGVVLGSESILFDAVYNVLRAKLGESQRSYDDPERFAKVTLDKVMGYLDTQDRIYHTFQVADPVSGSDESIVSDGTQAAERVIEKRVAKINEENEARLRAAFQEALKNISQRIDELESKVPRSSEEAKELRRLEGLHKTDLREIEKLEEAIKKRRDIQRKLSEEKAHLQKDFKKLPEPEKTERRILIEEIMDRLSKNNVVFMEQNRKAKERIAYLYKRVIGFESWKAKEIRIVDDRVRNLIKFIYVINADGEVVLCEEVVKGNNRKRATHSELARGRNVYGAGEVIFEKIDGDWEARELNNGSGHYCPSVLTLSYVAHLFAKKINLRKCTLNDVLSRGVSLPEYNAVLQAQTQ